MKKTSKIKLSPREELLFQALSPRWKPSHELCAVLFGGNELRWPLNARTMTTGTLASIGRKLKHYRSGNKLEKSGGGRAGTEYRLL